MTKNKDERDKKADEYNKWDLILANTFAIILLVGLLTAGIVLIKITG